MNHGRTRRTAILVAGMHRSGTSALTRLLNIAGCDLPNTLMTPRCDNETGFWESQPVADLNEGILASAGSSWDDWRPFDKGWYTSLIADEFRERAGKLLQSEFDRSRLFVLKDPRMCRLLRFWIEAVGACGARPLVVSPIRNPFDVSSSLHVRNDIDPGVGQLIWLRHVLDAEAASRGVVGRAYLRYEQLLSEAHALVDRLGNDLDVSWPKGSSPHAEMEIDEFLSPVLHHHRSDDASHRSNPRLSEWIKASFDIFDRWSHREVREEDTLDLDRIGTAFDEATPAFSRALAAGQRVKRNNQVLSEKLEDSRREVAKRDDRIRHLSEKLEDSRREVAKRDERIRHLSEKLEDSGREVAKRDDRILALSRDLETARTGHVVALAQRGSRFGVGELEVGILPNPEWLDQARRRHEGEPTLELRCNGRRTARVRVEESPHDLGRFPAQALVSGARLYSIHDALSGEVLAALAAPASRRARRVVGAVENRERPEIRGWVLDQSSPERSRRVAIHVDGHLREVVSAGEHRADIARWKGTGGHHGFRWRIPEGSNGKDGARVDVFDADTGQPLDGSPVHVERGQVVASERRRK